MNFLLCKQLGLTCDNEVNGTVPLAIVHNRVIRHEVPAVHLNDHFILEAFFTGAKEVSKLLVEFRKDLVDQVCLHLLWKHLEEVEFFDDHVEIVHESVLHCEVDV